VQSASREIGPASRCKAALRLEYGSVSKYLLDEKEECSDLEGYTMVVVMVIHLGDNSVFTIVYLSLTCLLM
jgi:hypothetical protein